MGMRPTRKSGRARAGTDTIPAGPRSLVGSTAVRRIQSAREKATTAIQLGATGIRTDATEAMLVGEILLEVAAESARARIGKESDTGVPQVTVPSIMTATESSGVGTTRTLPAMTQEGISGMKIVVVNTRGTIVEGTTVDIKIPAGETDPVTEIVAHTTAMMNEKPTSALVTMMTVGEMTVHGTGIASVIAGEMTTASGKAAEINLETGRLDRGATVRVGERYQANRTRVQIGAMALKARIGLARRIGQTTGIQLVRIELV